MFCYSCHVCDEFHYDQLKPCVSNSALQRFLTLNKCEPRRDIAQAGLYYLGIKDTYKCAFCDTVVRGSFIVETALEKHQEANPNCPFIQGEEVENLPLGDFFCEDYLDLLSLEKSMKDLTI